MYSNVAQWNNQAKEWLLQQDLQTVMLVEAHLRGIKQEQAKNALSRSRWQGSQCMRPDEGAPVEARFSAVEKGKRHIVSTNMTLMVMVSWQMSCSWEIVLVSIYLKCGEDLNSPANSTVLGALAAFLQELAVPWLVVGDFQVPPERWEGRNLLNVLKAELACSGQPTMINGAEIDYLLASRKVAPFLDVKAVNKAAPRLTLPQLTHFAAVLRLEDASRQWDEFQRPHGPCHHGRKEIWPTQDSFAHSCHMWLDTMSLVPMLWCISKPKQQT